MSRLLIREGADSQSSGGDLRGSGSGGSVVWVEDVGAGTSHWEASGRTPPQVGPQADGATTLEREGWWVGVSPSCGSYGGGGVT